MKRYDADGRCLSCRGLVWHEMGCETASAEFEQRCSKSPKTAGRALSFAEALFEVRNRHPEEPSDPIPEEAPTKGPREHPTQRGPKEQPTKAPPETAERLVMTIRVELDGRACMT